MGQPKNPRGQARHIPSTTGKSGTFYVTPDPNSLLVSRPVSRAYPHLPAIVVELRPALDPFDRQPRTRCPAWLNESLSPRADR